MMAELPPHNRTETSIEAAYSLVGQFEGMMLKVYAAVNRAGEWGFTCDELEVSLDMRHQTVSATLWALVNRKNALRVGPDKRPTRSGRRAFVYRVNTGNGSVPATQAKPPCLSFRSPHEELH